MHEFFHNVFAKHKRLRAAIAAIYGFLCGGLCLYGFYPFTCAAYMCAAVTGDAEIFAAAGAVSGLLIRGEYIHVLPLALCIAAGSLLRIVKPKGLNLTKAAAVLAVSGLSELIFFHSRAEDLTVAAIMCIVSELAFFVMLSGTKTLCACIKRKRLASDTEILYVSLFFGLFILLLTPYSVHTFNAARTAAGVIIFIMSLMPSPRGLYVGILSAAGCCIYKGEITVAYTGICAVSIIICSLIGKRKTRVALMYIVISFLLGLLTSHAIIISDAVVSSAIFLCIPQRYTDTLRAFLSVRDGRKSYAYRRKIDSIVRATGSMSDTFSLTEMQGDGNLAKRQFIALSGLLEGIYDERRANPRISVEVGCACIPKDGCAHTGDSVGKAICCGKTVIAVSDGMGSGLPAHNESAAAVDAFLDMQRAGFDTLDSTDCCNRRLLSRDGELYATLDAFVIDTYSGICTAVKLGSPPSYVLHEGKITEIAGESLPLGIVETVNPTVQKFRVETGDLLIIMTDGVSDALLHDIYAEITENAQAHKTPKKIANALLCSASRDGAYDDMSVVCARIVKTDGKKSQHSALSGSIFGKQSE